MAAKIAKGAFKLSTSVLSLESALLVAFLLLGGVLAATRTGFLGQALRTAGLALTLVATTLALLAASLVTLLSLVALELSLLVALSRVG